MISLPNTESGTIKIVTRNTYDAKKEQGQIDATTIYFVLENATGAENYLTLYVGLRKQSDLACLNDFTDLVEVFDENQIPVKDLLAREKIYYWEDVDSGVFRAYIRSSVEGHDEVLPLYGTPLWEAIETT